MNRIGIDIVMLLALLLASHRERFRLRLGPPSHEPPPVVCNANLVCR